MDGDYASLVPDTSDADSARTRALAAYKDFLTLWKDADPDIPSTSKPSRIRETPIALQEIKERHSDLIPSEHRMRRMREQALVGEGATVMESESESKTESNQGTAEAHIRSAQRILKALQEKIGEHPEIGAAITKLEMALNDLAIQTGGIL